jgi:hypothetical protein
MNVCLECKNCCYSKCGVVLEELNPHLPFGDHVGDIFSFFGQEHEGFLHFLLFAL